MTPPDAMEESGSLALLRRFARRRSPGERCELCSREIGVEHSHLLDPAKRQILCACEPCSVLFSDRTDARLRRVPRDVRFLPDFRMSDEQWNRLLIPIEMAFFFKSSVHNRTIAFYPSPAGATESLLELESWNEVTRENPLLDAMQPDVEALLVNRVGAARGVAPEHYIAPVDKCYKLVGLIRMHWRGLSGGVEVWGEIAKFFSELKERAQVVREAANA